MPPTFWDSTLAKIRQRSGLGHFGAVDVAGGRRQLASNFSRAPKEWVSRRGEKRSFADAIVGWSSVHVTSRAGALYKSSQQPSS